MDAENDDKIVEKVSFVTPQIMERIRNAAREARKGLEYETDQDLEIALATEQEIIASCRADMAAKVETNLSDAIWRRIDWMGVLYGAIKSRPTSWNEHPVKEWRNASDEIQSSVMRALEKAGCVKPLFEKALKSSLGAEQAAAKKGMG